MDLKYIFNYNLKDSLYVFSILSFAIYSQDNLQTPFFPLINKKTNLNWFGNSVDIIKQKINLLFENLDLNCEVFNIKQIYEDSYPDGNLCYIYKIKYHDKKITVICFRGTETNKNWWTNFYSIYANKVHIGPNISVAKSFYNSFSDIYIKVINYLDNEHSNQDNEYAGNLFVVGHSLGGVYASLLCYNLLQRNYQNLNLISINSPRVGDYNYSKYLNYSLNINYRLFTFPDIICTLPPQNLLYYHTGKGICISFNTESKLNISIKDTSSSDPKILDDSPNLFNTLVYNKNIIKNIKSLFELHGISFLGTNTKEIIPKKKNIEFFNTNINYTKEINYSSLIYIKIILIIFVILIIYLLKR